MLKVRGAGYRAGVRWLVRDATLHVGGGEFWAVLGPNGAGKTTLLRMVCGDLAPDEGTIELLGRPLHSYSIESLAKVRACLSQQRHVPFPFTSFEVAMLGRTPHVRGFSESSVDRSIVARSLMQAEVLDLSDRTYPSLSGGEATRVDIARVLAQEPKLLLLDEPTNHLDPGHQMKTLQLCKSLAKSGCAVVAVLHDLNMAALHADKLLLMHNGTVAAAGTPEEVLTHEIVRDVYGLACEVWTHPSGKPWIVPIANDIAPAIV